MLHWNRPYWSNRWTVEDIHLMEEVAEMATEKFESLDEGKKKRILNAALQEFAENGFAQASTNRIVKEAGIGKGMLFYYFNNKKGLYQYLFDYSVKVIQNDFLARIDMHETDFIERMRQMARLKLQVMKDKPGVFNFMGTVMLTRESELPDDIKTRIEALEKLGYEKMYANVDTGLFRDDVGVEKAYKLIQWAIDGYQNEVKARLKGQKMTSIDLEPLWKEFYGYMDVMKTIFYKQGVDEA